MADNLLTGQDLISQDGRVALDYLEKKLISIEAEMQRTVTTAGKLSKEIQGTKFTVGNDGDRAKIEALAQELEALRQKYDSLTQAKTKTVKLTALEKEAARQAAAEERALAKATLATADSYNNLSAELSLNLIQMKKMKIASLENTKAGRDLAKTILSQRDELKKLDASMGLHVRNVGNYGSALNGVIGAVKQLVVAYVSLSGAQQVIGAIFGQTKALNGQKIALEQVLGSTKKAAEAQVFLRDITERLGIDLITAAKSYLKFRTAAEASGLSVEETNKTFESFAKVGSVLGLSTQELDRLFKGLEQTLSKGTVSSEELRGQIGDVLPGAFTAAADAIGVTTGELQKMLKDGEVVSKDFLPKFAAQIEKAYGTANVTRIDNVAAAQGRFNRSITLIIEELDASNVFKTFFNSLTSIFNVIGKNLDTILSLGKAVFYLASAWTAWKLTMAAANSTWLLSLRLGVLDITQKGLQATATAALTAAQKALNTAVKANPIGVVFVAVTALVGAVDLLNDKVSQQKQLQRDLKEANQKANAEIEFQKVQINQLVKAYSGKKVAQEADKVILTQLRDLGVEIVDSNKDQIISIDELTASTNGYIKALEIQIKNEVLIAKIRGAIEEKTSLEEDIKNPKSNRYESLNAVLDRTFGTTLSTEGKQKRVDELTKYITDVERSNEAFKLLNETIANIGTKSDKAAPTVKELKTKLEDLKESLVLAQFNGDKNSITTLKDQIKELESVLNTSTKEAKNFLDTFERRKAKNSLIFDDQTRELDALKITLDEQLKLYKANGIDTTDLIQHFADLRVDILNKYIDKQDAANQRLFNRTKADAIRAANIIFQVLPKRGVDQTSQQKLDSFDAEQEHQLRILELNKHTEIEIQKFKIDQEIARLKFILNLNEINGKKLTDIEKTRINETIDALAGQKGRIGDDNPKDLFDLLGFDTITDPQKQVVNDAFNFAKDQLQSFFELKGKLIQQDLDRANNALTESQNFYNAQIALAAAGYANEVDTANKRVILAKKQQQDALKAQAKFNKEQIALNSALEASNLAVAIAGVFKTFPNPIVSIPLVALMVGAFAVSKLKAFQLAKQQFGEGGLEIIGGGTHESGNDTPLGFTTSSGKQAYGERDEAHAIIKATRTRQYKPQIKDVVQSFNNGTFHDRWVRRDQVGMFPTFSGVSISTSAMEGSLNKIVRQGETKDRIEGGFRVITKGARTTRIRVE